jgi:outer membrane murein-binding lipoprotein Lpp
MKDDQPSSREILDAVVHLQDVMAGAIGRIELDLGTVKADVGTLKSDVAVLKSDVAVLKSDVAVIKTDVVRLERRVIRIDDRLAVIEGAAPIAMLADHERRITRLEGLSDLTR